MKKSTLTLATVLFTQCLNAEDGYQPIFDGKTLTGWHIMSNPKEGKYHATTDNFFAKDQALVCFQSPNKKGGMILSDGKYADFELQLEFKNDWGCDSGIMLRCNEQGQGIQILNDYLRNGCVGFPFGQGTGGYISRPILLNEQDGTVLAKDVYDAVKIDNLVYAINAEGWNNMWKHNDWNTIKIRCVGTEPKIVTWINGIKIMEMNGATYTARSLKNELKKNWDAKPAWNRKKVRELTGGKGSIGLQIHPGGRWKRGGSVQYRNIRIKELK